MIVAIPRHLPKMERNSHERTSRWKMYGKQMFFEDLEVRDETQSVDASELDNALHFRLMKI
jgi:hypothetical protein